jgi:hypothetical protein
MPAKTETIAVPGEGTGAIMIAGVFRPPLPPLPRLMAAEAGGIVQPRTAPRGVSEPFPDCFRVYVLDSRP